MQRYRHIFGNSYSLSLFKKMTTIIIGVFTTSLLTRFLGPENKGHYSYILSIMSISTTLMNLGINQSYPYFKRKNPDYYLEVFISLSIFIFTCLSTFGIISAFVFDDITVALIVIFTSISVLRLQLTQYTLVENFKKHSYSIIFSSFLNLLILLVIVNYTRSNVYIALLIYFSKDILIILTSIPTLKKQVKSIKLFDYINWKQIIKFGLAPMYVTLLVSFNYQLDIIMLNIFSVDLSQIGYYSVGLSLAQYAWFIPDIFKDVLVNKTAVNDDINSLNFSLRISSLLLILVYIGIILFGRLALTILFGVEFISSYLITVIVFAGIFSMMYTKLIATLYIAKGNLKFYSVVMSLAIIVNIISNVFLIPQFNIYGAAISTVGSYMISGVLFLIKYKLDYKLTYRELLFINKQDLNKISDKLPIRESR